MNQPVLDFTAAAIAEHGLYGKDVLEVGSYIENGTVRGLFPHAATYLGVDIRPGPGVDLVMNAHDLRFVSSMFDVVACTEMLEHDEAFWLSLAEMTRVLRPGGILILTARGIGFPYHEFPHDYYRFTEDAFRYLFESNGLEVLKISPCPEQGVLGCARKLPC